MNIKSLNIHLRIHLTADCSLNDKAMINNKVIKITYIFVRTWFTSRINEIYMNYMIMWYFKQTQYKYIL
jgi:hypothetical protein